MIKVKITRKFKSFYSYWALDLHVIPKKEALSFAQISAVVFTIVG